MPRLLRRLLREGYPIEVFIEGPAATPRQRPTTIARERRPVELDTRPDWTAAFRHEGARHARYGRSASVLLIELGGSLEGAAVDQVAHRLADAIRSLLSDDHRRQQLGAAARQRAESAFDIRNATANLIEQYRTVLK